MIAALLLVGLVFGVLGSWVASQKHRAATEGAVLGFLFGPLGVLAEAVLPHGIPSGTTFRPTTRETPRPTRPLWEVDAADLELSSTFPGWRRFQSADTGADYYTPAD
jgi:hypothetical protein